MSIPLICASLIYMSLDSRTTLASLACSRAPAQLLSCTMLTYLGYRHWILALSYYLFVMEIRSPE